jgi:hypothetical protein
LLGQVKKVGDGAGLVFHGGQPAGGGGTENRQRAVPQPGLLNQCHQLARDVVDIRVAVRLNHYVAGFNCHGHTSFYHRDLPQEKKI